MYGMDSGVIYRRLILFFEVMDLCYLVVVFMVIHFISLILCLTLLYYTLLYSTIL